jgi:bifunctional ADP-heptose synthase (sugar kinase/adenylyltransferase)
LSPLKKRKNPPRWRANVAINIQSLGATPLLCSVIGTDANSRLFVELMQRQGHEHGRIYLSPSRATTHQNPRHWK